MKRSRFACLLFCMATVSLLTSCGGDESKKPTSTDSTAVDSSTTVKPVVNTIITTPQNMMVVTNKVSNFSKWKTVYDQHDSVRLVNGIHSFVIGRGLQDSNIVIVAVKVDDIAKAKAFAKDPNVKKTMQKAGVIGAPSFSFVTTTFQDTADINSPLRSRTTLTVKDWNAWQKAFEEGKQERIDNGIVVRAYGHDVDDNKKVSLVTALIDTAKAYAYWKSDMQKKRREAAGVIGQPNRFTYRLVQRY